MKDMPQTARTGPLPGRKGLWLWLAVLLCALILFWQWHARWAHPWLTVRNDLGLRVFSAPLPSGQEFGIRFVHSVALSPVEEWFVAEDGQVALRRTVYQDFGAGLPHEAAEGQRMVFADGRIELSGFTLKLPQMAVRVGRVARHALLLADNRGEAAADNVPAPAPRVFPLVAWAAPGRALHFTVETPPLRDRVRELFENM